MLEVREEDGKSVVSEAGLTVPDLREGGRERGREGGREAWGQMGWLSREGGREGGKEERREGGREGYNMCLKRKTVTSRERKGREKGRKEGREGGREGGRAYL